ncbi:MAG: helix-turn-helix domain-containing protein [Bacteroidota bacterium]
MEEQYIKLIFGLKLKQLRLKRNLSLFGLSKLSGLSKSYLNEIEKGKKYPKTDKIALLAEKLEVPYDNLVSLKLDKNLAPVGELLRSNILKELPLELFGIKESDLIDIVANAPTKVNAFISTIIDIAKHYNLGRENFYLASVRSHQEANNNFFPELEKSVVDFSIAYQIDLEQSVSSKELEEILVEEFGYSISNEDLGKFEGVENLRSVFIPKTKTLLLANHVDETQRTFIYAKELGYNYMHIEDRLFTFPWIKFENFDQVLNNFYASYFAGALIMPRKLIRKHVNEFLDKPVLDRGFLSILRKNYNASPESLYQRLTNILPNDFYLDNLFFLRFSHQNGSDRFKITKEFHLTQSYVPQENGVDEKFCRRWVSIRVLKEISKKDGPHHMEVRISKYPSIGRSYLIFSSATRNPNEKEEYRSIILGFLINDALRKRVNFIDDPAIKVYEVDESYEQWEIFDYQVRNRPSKVLQQREINDKTSQVVKDLNKKYG